MHNFNNSTLDNPHGYKEKVKVKYKYNATTLLSDSSPIEQDSGNITSKKIVLLTWIDYCATMPENQPMWEDKATDLGKAMLLLLNLKNKPAKRDFYLAYAQRNHSTYPKNVEKIAVLLWSQYSYKKNSNPCNKRGTRTERRVTTPNQKLTAITIQVLQVHI